jgi:hypothetical protein
VFSLSRAAQELLHVEYDGEHVQQHGVWTTEALLQEDSAEALYVVREMGVICDVTRYYDPAAMACCFTRPPPPAGFQTVASSGAECITASGATTPSLYPSVLNNSWGLLSGCTNADLRQACIARHLPAIIESL